MSLSNDKKNRKPYKNTYLIANNPQNIKFLNNHTFNENDHVIVFNNNRFKSHPAFKNIENITHFYRCAPDKLHGQRHFIGDCQCKKVIISLKKNHPVLLHWISQDDTLSYYAGFWQFLNKYQYREQNKEPQTGSLVFEVLKEYNYINKKSKIFLVGFTSIYDRGLWHGHSKDLEDQYFKSQQEVYKGLIYLNDHVNN